MEADAAANDEADRDARRPRRPAAGTTVVLVVAVVVLLVSAVRGFTTGSGPTSTSFGPAETAVIVSIPGLRWQDLVATDTPAIDSYLGRAGVLSVRAIGPETDLLEGYLTLELWLAHRERVRALVLIGTGPGYRKDDAREGWNRMAARFADEYDAKGLDALGSSEEVSASVHRDATGLARAARGILTQHDGRVMEALSSIDVPTLVLWGEDDKLDPPETARMLYAALLCKKALHIIPGNGHVGHLDRNRDKVFALTSDWALQNLS